MKKQNKRKLNKSRVYQVYNHILDWFDTHRDKNLLEKEYLDLIAETLPLGSRILDLGCGTGEPIAGYFIDRGFQVMGVDGSELMITLCKQRFPEAHWLVADMREIRLPQRFDALLAWHSFFHLDAESQRKMFQVFADHLKPNGMLAFTSGEEEGEVWSDNGGHLLYHASLSPEEYEKCLNAAGFEVILHRVRDPRCGEATVWVARKN